MNNNGNLFTPRDFCYLDFQYGRKTNINYTLKVAIRHYGKYNYSIVIESGPSIYRSTNEIASFLSIDRDNYVAQLLTRGGRTKSSRIYFRTEEAAQQVADWIESLLVMKALIGAE